MQKPTAGLADESVDPTYGFELGRNEVAPSFPDFWNCHYCLKPTHRVTVVTSPAGLGMASCTVRVSFRRRIAEISRAEVRRGCACTEKTKLRQPYCSYTTIMQQNTPYRPHHALPFRSKSTSLPQWGHVYCINNRCSVPISLMTSPQLGQYWASENPGISSSRIDD
jgi:hypothetical protein